ncbi:hypothetical protein C7B76_12280, partial [filamentous cyanobacterium CCP2]
MLAAAFSLGAASSAVAGSPLAQAPTIEGTDFSNIADLLTEHDCVIRTYDGFVVNQDGSLRDWANDSYPEYERVCTPGLLRALYKNENFAEVDLLTDYSIGDYEADNTLLIDIDNIISVRNVTPGNYVFVVSESYTPNSAHVVDLREVSEEEALLLLRAIETRQVVTIPEPAPLPPRPPVQPAP